MSAIISLAFSNANLASLIANTLHLKLFSNDYVPSVYSEASDFVETSGGNYSQIVIAPSDWTQTDNFATVGVKQFTFSGPTTAGIYGCYILTEGGVFRYAQRFADTIVPFNPVVNAYIRVALSMTVNY